MEDHSYCVVLDYDQENPEIREKVTACLSRLDPTAPQRFNDTKTTGRLIVKRSTDLATAKRLVRILRNTGAHCSVQKRILPPQPKGKPDTDSRRKMPATRPETLPQLIECPNCGCSQPRAVECRACGIVFSKAKPRLRPAPIDPPAAPPREKPAKPSPIMQAVRRFIHALTVLSARIQHPIRVEKLTSWARKVADRAIRCGLVFCIALILEIGLLALGKMLWFIYVHTPVGQYYLQKMPEEAQMYQSVIFADPLTLGWDITTTVLLVGLFLGCIAQFLHLIRYFYESQGIIGKLVLWFVPVTALSARLISQVDPFPEFFLAITLAALPTLCMLSSCLYLAQTVLPELGDFRTILNIILENKDKTWGYVIKKIRIWLDSSKKVH